jgi:hypothetical protein
MLSALSSFVFFVRLWFAVSPLAVLMTLFDDLQPIELQRRLVTSLGLPAAA